MTNHELIRHFFDCFNRHELETIEAFLAPDIRMHDTFLGETTGIESFRQLGELFLTAFPDQHTTVTQLVSEGDLIAALHTHTGTHLGNFGEVPPTGKPFSISGLELFRITDGKISEFWRHDDEAGLLRQLGLIPAGTEEEA